MSKLSINVVTPYGEVFSGESTGCTAPGIDGEFSILESHASFISLLQVGEVRMEVEGKTRLMAISGGVLEVRKNVISIMAETAEWAEDIEVDRARDAENRARKRLEDKGDTDQMRAELALARAINRLKVASHL